MKSIGELFSDAQAGNLTKEEIDYVANKIRVLRNRKDPDLYLWLVALGEAGAIDHRKLIESFLYAASDPEVAEAAFVILTRDWGFTKDYIHELKFFLKGIDWDKQGNIRKSAIFAAESYLTQDEDQDLCDTLIKIIEDPNEKDSLREQAYFALPKAMRGDLKYTLPPMTKGSRVSSEISLRSTDELLHEAKVGKLTQEEIGYVANRIKASRYKTGPDLHTLIAILGEAQAIEYRDLVESFLYQPFYPDISEIAFVVLTSRWGLIDEYIKELKLFLKGVDWDEREDIRRNAVSITGWYLTNHEDKDLLETLIRIVEDDTEDELIHETAYLALGEAMGRNIIQVYYAKEIDPSIIKDAKQRLAVCK